MIRGPKFDTPGHTDVWIGIVIVHTGTASHSIQRIKQVIQKLFVGTVTTTVFVGFHNGNNHGNIGRGDTATSTLISRMMSTTTLDVFGINTKRGKGNGRHGGIYRFNGCTTLIRIHIPNT